MNTRAQPPQVWEKPRRLSGYTVGSFTRIRSNEYVILFGAEMRAISPVYIVMLKFTINRNSFSIGNYYLTFRIKIKRNFETQLDNIICTLLIFQLQKLV